MARTLKPQSSMLALLPHATFTLSQLQAHPLGAPYVPLYEAIRAEGREVNNRELDLIEEKAAARAVVVATDSKADNYVSRLSKAVLTITGDDRSSGLYTHYFDKPVSELTRPILRGQLATMRKWLISLPLSPHAALSGMAAELAALVDEADQAEAALQLADARIREFRDVGERRQWVDRLNAARKEVHGALAKLPHEHPELSSDFADQFFLSEPGRDDDDDDSVEALQAKEAALQKDLSRVQARLAEVTRIEAEEKKAAEERAAKAAALAELEREAAALEKRRAALKAELTASR